VGRRAYEARMHQVIVFHHADDAHVEAFTEFMGRVTTAVAGADGLLEFSSWREVGSARLVATSRWTSAEAFQAALPLVMSRSGERRPEWTTAPDEVFITERLD
jgi:quinol monooxygenase YgiN